ncbi:helix-turn-helix domain-containing protein [Enterococcus sp. HY326]|uniref:helix-turn-helix domain-containing protein n=1 Tax=Enterococcus sp. HY326 TaxID=2971265 RepID=UPI00223FC330|nr:helix-turn-helix domain-containing protein [Enterococcus sp. HY326]
MEEMNKEIKVIYSQIAGEELLDCYKSVIKNKNISKSLQTTLEKVGRPQKISDKQVEKAYEIWKTGKMTQREIALELGVSERTLRRYFKERNQ